MSFIYTRKDFDSAKSKQPFIKTTPSAEKGSDNYSAEEIGGIRCLFHQTPNTPRLVAGLHNHSGANTSFSRDKNRSLIPQNYSELDLNKFIQEVNTI